MDRDEIPLPPPAILKPKSQKPTKREYVEWIQNHADADYMDVIVELAKLAPHATMANGASALQVAFVMGRGRLRLPSDAMFAAPADDRFDEDGNPALMLFDDPILVMILGYLKLGELLEIAATNRRFYSLWMDETVHHQRMLYWGTDVKQMYPGLFALGVHPRPWFEASIRAATWRSVCGLYKTHRDPRIAELVKLIAFVCRKQKHPLLSLEDIPTTPDVLVKLAAFLPRPKKVSGEEEQLPDEIHYCDPALPLEKIKTTRKELLEWADLLWEGQKIAAAAAAAALHIEDIPDTTAITPKYDSSPPSPKKRSLAVKFMRVVQRDFKAAYMRCTFCRKRPVLDQHGNLPKCIIMPWALCCMPCWTSDRFHLPLVAAQKLWALNRKNEPKNLLSKRRFRDPNEKEKRTTRVLSEDAKAQASIFYRGDLLAATAKAIDLADRRISDRENEDLHTIRTKDSVLTLQRDNHSVVMEIRKNRPWKRLQLITDDRWVRKRAREERRALLEKPQRFTKRLRYY